MMGLSPQYNGYQAGLLTQFLNAFEMKAVESTGFERYEHLLQIRPFNGRLAINTATNTVSQRQALACSRSPCRGLETWRRGTCSSRDRATGVGFGSKLGPACDANNMQL